MNARESRSAGKSLKAANKATDKVAENAKKAAHKRDAALADGQRDLYRFALESLEGSG